MRPSLTIETYRDVSGDWRWRARHRNGRVMAESGEGYRRRVSLLRALDTLGMHFARARVVNL